MTVSLLIETGVGHVSEKSQTVLVTLNVYHPQNQISLSFVRLGVSWREVM